MINVYCLIDPRDRKPFYVGVTVSKINIRLAGHISEIKTYPPCNYSTKMAFIADIINSGKKPQTRLLITASIHDVDHYEYFFYKMFTHQGFNLIQKPTAFSYSKKSITDKNKISLLNSSNQRIKKYSQLRYKNILIIIW